MQGGMDALEGRVLYNFISQHAYYIGHGENHRKY